MTRLPGVSGEQEMNVHRVPGDLHYSCRAVVAERDDLKNMNKTLIEALKQYADKGNWCYDTCNIGRVVAVEALDAQRERIVTELTPPAELDASGLVEAASAALDEIENIMQEAHNSAYAVCCGRAGSECCGSPEPEWSKEAMEIMDRLDRHQRALNAALSAFRKKNGE